MRKLHSATVVCLALAALPEPASGAERRAATIADVYRVKGVAGPAIAPDGKGVAFAVTTTELAAVHRQTNLWRADADGRNARALTASDKSDSSPAFSPDGTALGFLSTRAGAPQVFFLPTAGGEAEQKTDVPGGVGSFLFTPDGKHLVIAAEVWPECGADVACNRRNDEAMEKGKMKAHLADRLLFRHWDAWEDGKRTHLLLVDLSDAKAPLRDLTPGDFDSPAFVVGGGTDYDVSPDGQELVFTSNREAQPATSTNSDLWVVPIDGSPEALAAPRNITLSNRAFDGTPRYSPDGRTLAYTMQRVAGYESDRIVLALYDRAAGTRRVVTEALDAWVRLLRFAPDGSRIFFTADVKGRTPLHALDLATGKIDVVSNVGHVDAFEVSRDGAWAAVARRRMHQPAELYRVALAAEAAGKESALTSQNQALLDEVDFRPMEEVFVDGPAGKVQVLLVKPHGFDPAKKYPAIVNVHGGPQQQWEDSFRGDAQVYPGAGYVVAFPNPHGSTGWGQAYTAEISGDWDGKVMQDVMAVTDWLAAQPYVDRGRLGAMGWSWGGYAMMWLAGHGDRFKALAAMMGVYDLRAMYSATEELWFPEWDLKGTPWQNPEGYRRQSPSSYVPQFKTPTLVVTGEKDFRVPYTQSLEFFTDLQKRGVPSRLVVFEDSGHWPGWYDMVLYYAAHLDWFHTYLGGGASPWDPKALVRNTVFGGAGGEKAK